MWPEVDFRTMTPEEFRAWQRVHFPPDNEIARVVALNAQLVKTDDVAVSLTHCHVYSRGVRFFLSALFRIDDEHDGRVSAAIGVGPDGQSDLLLLVGLADGVAISAPVGEVTQGKYLVRHMPSTSTTWNFHTSLWLTPLPPPGSLSFSIDCPSLGIQPSMADVDATVLRDAATKVHPVWEWDS